MNFSERNKKVALSRWSKIRESEKAILSQDDQTLKIKAALCGFLAGDGSVQIRKSGNCKRYDLGFYPDDIEMLSVYVNFINRVYGKNPSIKNHKNFSEVRITSRNIVEDLLKHSEFGINSWSLPLNLFQFKGTKEAWIKAFFSAEAYVGKDHIRVQTVNKEGMKKVSQMLLKLGIEHKCYKYLPKNKNHSEVYIIAILKKQSRKVYLDKIGFWHSKKTKSARKTLGL